MRNIIAANGSDGIGLNSASGTVIEGNYIGTDQSGEIALGNTGNGITAISSNSIAIGGTVGAARNIISANADGVFLSGSNDTVQGNFIGVNASGARGLGNKLDGLFLTYTNDITIGGATAGMGNVISANGGAGVDLNALFPNLNGASQPSQGSGYNIGNLIQGNFVGTDSTARILWATVSGGSISYSAPPI